MVPHLPNRAEYRAIDELSEIVFSCILLSFGQEGIFIEHKFYSHSLFIIIWCCAKVGYKFFGYKF